MMPIRERGAWWDERQLRAAVQAICLPGRIYELRALHVPNGATVSGYFDDEHREALIEAAMEVSGLANGVYVTLNPCLPALMSRAENRIQKYARHTTKDDEIIHRDWLLIDFDPARPGGVSSTQSEQSTAVARARKCREALIQRGWPMPLLAMSGNGAHLLYRIDLPNDPPSKELVSQVLVAIAAEFGDEQTPVDMSVFNAARISKLYGTVAAKGDDTPDRPHRIAEILESPERLEVVSRGLLEMLAFPVSNPIEERQKNAAGPRHALPAPIGAIVLTEWLERQKISHGPAKPWNGGNLYELHRCPWRAETDDGGAWVAQLADGTILAGCHHSKCQSKGWPELRDIIEPGWHESAGAINEAENDPHRLARLFLSRRYWHAHRWTLANWQGSWFKWTDCVWQPADDSEIRAELTATIKGEFDRLAANGKDKTPRLVTTGVTNNVLQALRSLITLPSTIEQPAWLVTGMAWPANEVLPARNRLVHLPSFGGGINELVIPPTPKFFAQIVLDYDFDPTAPPPKEWLRFLSTLWPNDPESIALLQEFMGYLLTLDTRQHKILFIVGPPRSGKGTICRVILALVGPDNVAGPTLYSLSQQFGLSALLGKSVAIIADARLGRWLDSASVVGRLLSISGEDTLSIDRKFLPAINTKLTSRIILVSNELPRLPDASGAISSRFLVLRLTASFVGNEDTSLGEKLSHELPAILLWSVDGYRRYQARGCFIQPSSAIEVLADLKQLTSPVAVFVGECCELGQERSIKRSELHEAFKAWCQNQGAEADSPESFGRNLRAVVPTLTTRQITVSGNRQREYVGIALRGNDCH